MKELKSKGCVTVRDTEKRLSCKDNNFSTADLLFYLGKMASRYVHDLTNEEQEFAITAYTLHIMEA